MLPTLEPDEAVDELKPVSKCQRGVDEAEVRKGRSSIEAEHQNALKWHISDLFAKNSSKIRL